ncbi:hypothetical protein CDIK_3326, partial [Cucumispora dikerogammari]
MLLLNLIQADTSIKQKITMQDVFKLKRNMKLEVFEYLKDFNDCCAELRKKSEEIKQTFDDNCYKLFDKHPIFDRIKLESIITAGAESKSSLNFNLSRKYIDIEKEVRAMFFIELFSLCRNFFSELRYIISEKEKKMQPLSPLAITAFLNNIKMLPFNFCKFNNINEDTFASKKLYSLSFMEILEQLETEFCNKTHVSKLLLRTCLYTTPNYHYYTNDKTHIKHFFYTLAYFMKYDSNSDPQQFKQNFIDAFKKQFPGRLENKGIILYDLINKDYADCLVIEMKTEYKNSVNRRQEPGFKAYNKSLNVLRGCCFSGNDNLVTATCKKPEHNKLINDIRYKHCNTIIDDF